MPRHGEIVFWSLLIGGALLIAGALALWVLIRGLLF